jgi:hypothetical protein
MIRSMDPKFYSLERTSACHGDDNPDGWGFELTYKCGGDIMEFILPDHIAIEWCITILKMLAERGLHV